MVPTNAIEQWLHIVPSYTIRSAHYLEGDNTKANVTIAADNTSLLLLIKYSPNLYVAWQIARKDGERLLMNIDITEPIMTHTYNIIMEQILHLLSIIGTQREYSQPTFFGAVDNLWHIIDNQYIRSPYNAITRR
jgi:hypothetical protein